MVHGREKTITLSEVKVALRAKKLQKTPSKASEAVAESLHIKKFKKHKFKKKFEDGKPSTSDSKETRSCHWCKKPGHLKKDCFAWKIKQANEGKTQNSSDCVEEVEFGEIMNVVEGGISEYWIMDSGGSFHMCPYKHWFCELKEATGTVLLGNNHICNIKGISMVRLRMHDGSVRVLGDVRWIPEIKRNLVSLGMLERKSFSFASFGGKMVVKRGLQVLMEAERRNSLYYLLAEAVVNESHSVGEVSLKV